VILYEYPLNERIRTLLRMEQLFSRLASLLERDDAISHHFALVSIDEIIEIGARADFRNELLRELEKQKITLIGFRGNPAISELTLENHINTIEDCYGLLNNLSGKLGQPLRDNGWLSSVNSRLLILGGSCSFDLPTYHQWRSGSIEKRKIKLFQWVKSLLPYSDAIHLLLKMYREAGVPQKILAHKGQYQQNLPINKVFQLLRIFVSNDIDAAPEVSANRMLISLRMLRTDFESLPVPTNEDCSLDVALCV
jgi:cell division protein ZapD